ncbi:hypothetical protein [Chondromyces apiculatus]|uniref:Uncharacterized protein n=1 Tax=Chondromyces apiculatus DSM 436 TaxID=1192034 RepID=A0A017TFW5_9BACT|nr:hypothetical protein [Chondromyces apiculatus]EYF08109.1 Hypothetical protein CAP_5869 [Chondromyces apiculatus DSM 436]
MQHQDASQDTVAGLKLEIEALKQRVTELEVPARRYVTGVPSVDAQIAGYLRNTVRAAELLGSRCLIVGMKRSPFQGRPGSSG